MPQTGSLVTDVIENQQLKRTGRNLNKGAICRSLQQSGGYPESAQFGERVSGLHGVFGVQFEAQRGFQVAAALFLLARRDQHHA